MSKHRNKHRPYTGMQTRQQAQDRQHQKEIFEAQQGYIEETDAEITMQANATQIDWPIDITEEATPLKKDGKKWYVLDTNLIISCVDVLYDDDDEDWREPINFKPRLDNAHLIIPKTVYDELDHLKDEVSRRGLNARIAFERLAKFFPNSGRTLEKIANLSDPITTGWKKQTISLLPLHKEFKRILPWMPNHDDNDGWIAVTALAATMIHEGLAVDGTQKADILKRSNTKKDVTLLTNDNGLLSLADLYGVYAETYSFTKRPLFTGVRELTVPAEMFEIFYHEEKLTRSQFEHYMPKEPPLVANEYIVMTPKNDVWPRGYYSLQIPFPNVARYHAENGLLCPLRFAKHEQKTPPNAGIAAYYDALNDDKIQVVCVTGAAGTGKTYQAITHAIKEIRAGNYVKAILIPSRSAKNPLGALPGNQEQKMEPLVAAAKDAIRSYLASTPEFQKMRELLKKFGDDERAENAAEEDDYPEKKKKKQKDGRDRKNYRDYRRTYDDYPSSFESLDYENEDYSASDFSDQHNKKKGDKTFYPGKQKKADGEKKLSYYETLEKETNYLFNRYFVSMPYEDAEGHSFDDCIVILDEFQRVQVDDSDTLITRPGKRSKLIICGDIAQIHNNSTEKCFNNGLNYARMLYYDEPIAANVHLTTNMRGDISRIATKNRYKVRRLMGLI